MPAPRQLGFHGLSSGPSARQRSNLHRRGSETGFEGVHPVAPPPWIDGLEPGQAERQLRVPTVVHGTASAGHDRWPSAYWKDLVSRCPSDGPSQSPGTKGRSAAHDASDDTGRHWIVSFELGPCTETTTPRVPHGKLHASDVMSMAGEEPGMASSPSKARGAQPMWLSHSFG